MDGFGSLYQTRDGGRDIVIATGMWLCHVNFERRWLIGARFVGVPFVCSGGAPRRMRYILPASVLDELFFRIVPVGAVSAELGASDPPHRELMIVGLTH